MKFDIVTIFPQIFNSYLNESILKRAQEKKLIQVKIHNLRDFAQDKHNKVDDKPYGGGAGMVFKAEPILRAVHRLKISKRKSKIIVFSAKGKQFNQKIAYDWAKKCSRIIFVTGRYEGIDERARQILKAEEISIGPYVMTDGDVAAMVVISAISRLLPGVISFESLEEESYFNNLIKDEQKKSKGENLEYPHFTRPEIIEWQGKKHRVPKVLLSGNHSQIEKWRKERVRHPKNQP